MHFHRTLTVTDPVKVAALAAALPDAPAFGAYIHHGADNAPVMYELFKSPRPPFDEYPIATATRQDDGVFAVVAAPPKAHREKVIKTTVAAIVVALLAGCGGGSGEPQTASEAAAQSNTQPVDCVGVTGLKCQ